MPEFKSLTLEWPKPNKKLDKSPKNWTPKTLFLRHKFLQVVVGKEVSKMALRAVSEWFTRKYSFNASKSVIQASKVILAITYLEHD